MLHEKTLKLGSQNSGVRSRNLRQRRPGQKTQRPDLGLGKPFVFVYKGQEIKLCDKSEKADFDKEPDKYMKKLADEAAKQKK
jgi:hypothetical protein